MDVQRIFPSLEGEGIDCGIPTVFVRLQGCHLRCSYCDTKEAWNVTGKDRYSPNAVAAKVGQLLVDTGIRRVSFTGGDPLLQRSDMISTIRLLESIGMSGIQYHLEHAGAWLEDYQLTEQSLSDLFASFNSICFDLKVQESPARYALCAESAVEQLDRWLTWYVTKGCTLGKRPSASVKIPVMRDTFNEVYDAISFLCEESSLASSYNRAFGFIMSIRPHVAPHIPLLISPVLTKENVPVVPVNTLTDLVCALTEKWCYGQVRLSTQVHKFLGFE